MIGYTAMRIFSTPVATPVLAVPATHASATSPLLPVKKVHNYAQVPTWAKPAENLLKTVSNGQDWLDVVRDLSGPMTVQKAWALRCKLDQLKRPAAASAKGLNAEVGGAAVSISVFAGAMVDDRGFQQLLQLRKLCITHGGPAGSAGLLQCDFQAVYQQACIQKALRNVVERHGSADLTVEDLSAQFHQSNYNARMDFRESVIGRELVADIDRLLRLPELSEHPLVPRRGAPPLLAARLARVSGR